MTEIAWAAGLYEGEGTIALDRGYPHMGMVQNDGTVLERFRAAVQAGRVYDSRTRAWQQWSCRRLDDVERVLDLLAPWLGERRLIQAANVMANRRRLRRES